VNVINWVSVQGICISVGGARLRSMGLVGCPKEENVLPYQSSVYHPYHFVFQHFSSASKYYQYLKMDGYTY